MARSDEFVKQLKNKYSISDSDSKSTAETTGQGQRSRTYVDGLLKKYDKRSLVDEDYIQEFKQRLTRYSSQHRSDLDRISYFNSRDIYNQTKNSADDLLGQITAIRQYVNHTMNDPAADDAVEEDFLEWRTYLYDTENALKRSVASVYDIDQGYSAYRDVDVEAGRQELAEMDLAIEKLKLSALNNGLAAAYGGERSLGAAAQADRMELDGLIQQRSDTARKVNRASYLQEAAELAGVADPDSERYDPDFEKLKKYQTSDDETYEYINGKDNGNREAINRQHRLANYGSRSTSTYQQNNYDYLTDDEISIYNYYHAKYGKERAEKYLGDLSRTLQERANDETAQKASAFAERHPVLASAGSVATSLGSGLDYAGQLATDIVLGRELSAETNNMGLITNAVRESVAKQVNWEIGKWDAFDFLYTTAMSGADSLASGLLFGSGGGAVLGLSAAAQGTSDALDRGMSKGQAFWNGLISGVFEGLFETVSIGQFKQLQEVAPDTIKDFFKNLGKSMLVNASEESLTEIANIGYDTLVNGAFANYTMQELREGAWKDALAQVIEAGASGALMGVGMGAAGGAINYGQTSAAGRRVQSADQVARLQELGSLMSADSAAAQLAGKIDENTGAYTIGRLFHEVGASLTEQNKADIAASLESKGMDSEHAALHGEVMAYVVDGGQLSDVQMKMIEKNNILSKTLQEVLIDPNTTVYQRTTGYNQLLQELARKQSGVETAAAEETDGSPAPGSGQSQASQVKAREALDQQAEQKTAYLKEGGTPVAIAGIASTEGGKLILRTEAGETVEAANVDLGSMGPVYEAVASMDVSPSEANLLVNSYQMNREMDPGEYALRMQSAYRFGKMGIPLVQAQTSEATNRLTDQQLQAIYGLGRAFAGKQASREQQQVKQRGPRQTLRNMAEGSDYVEVSKEVWQNLTEKQNDQIEAVRYVADALQVKIVIYASREREGRREAPNGWYDPETDTIHLDIHAGLNGEGTMMFTLAHELTHRIRAWSPEKFKVLADFLMEQYGEKGVKVEALINRRLARVRKTYEGQKLTESQLYDIAFEEVVADSMEPMLTDGRVLQKLKARDQSIWEQLRDYIQELAQKIRKAYARLKPDSAEGQAVLRMKDSIEKIQEKFLEGLEDSAANAAGQQKTAPEGGKMAASARYSIRNNVTDTDGNQYDQVVSLEYAVFNKIRRKPKTYIDFIRNHLIHEKITVFNNNGVSEVIEFAGEKERVKKEGSSNSHPVIGELTQARNPIKKLVIVNASETAAISKFSKESDHVDQNSHQWLDANGWDYRTSYVMTNDGIIYPVTLFIAKARDGRNILYDVHVKFNEGIAAERNATSSEEKQAFRSTMPSEDMVAQSNGNSQGETKKVSIRYQERDPGLNRVNEALRTEKEGLREDFDRTKAVFDLLNIREQEGIFTQGSLEAVAKGLKQKSGATGSTKELAGLLQEGFQSVIQMKNPSWADVEEHLSPAVDWMMEHQKKHLDPRAQEALRHIRTSRVYLDKQQKGEAAYQYGSYNGYRKAAMGSIILTDKNAMSLDSWWHEMAEEFSDLGKFEKDLTSTDMPRRLLEIVKELRSLQTDMTFGIDTIGMEQDLLRQVYDGMIRAAVYPAQSGQLLSWQDQKLQDQKNENAAQVRKLMAKHQRQMQALKNSHEAEIRGLKKDFENRRAWQKSSRERTELRHRIQRTVKQLSSMLTRETRTRHIPEVLKMAVVDALDAVNMDTVMAEERLKALQKQLDETSDPDSQDEIRSRMRTVQEMGGSMKKKLEALSAAYAAVRADADPELSYAFDEEIGNQIQRVKDLVGSTPLRDMSKTQLEAVDELYTAVLTRVRDMNKAFATARQENIDGLGQAVIRQELALKQRDARLGLTQPLRAFFWNNEKPVYAFQRIGSGTLTELYNNVRQGEDVYARDMAEAREFQAETAKRFQKKDWDTKKTFPFHDRLGREFQLTLGQMMTLYAYSKREQAWDHLQYGGFQFAPDTQVLKRTKAGFEVAYNWSSAKTFKVDADILGDIISQLTDDQKAFADRMQSYLSDTMGAKGNEISMKLYGIRLFKERNYFPLKSSKAFLEQEKNKANGEVKIKNKGFTKQVQKYANNPVMLRSFDDIWADHVSDMSMYHGFTLPLEDFYRVRNYKEGIYDAEGLDAAQDSRSVVSAIQGAHGEEAVKYIEQLLKDLNGGAVGDPRAAIGKSLTSKHKKAAVMASLSVIAQQPTSIYRAMALVDAKYFGADNLLIPTAIKTMNSKKHRESWAEVKQYAPVAIIKEMGSFDTNVGRSGRDYLNAPEYEGLKERTKAFFTDSNYRDEALGKAAAVADELAWVAIWSAVKKETADRHRGLLGQNKEEFMKLAGERFTEVITKTQVYDSVLARSANMRSKDAGVSMAMSFMAEPTTTANMVEDGIRKLLQGDRKTAGKIFRGVLASHIMNSAVVSLVYAMRDDDEDETFTEKYVSRLATELMEGMNPVTYIPYARDVWSVFQGYDVERADMTLVSDLAAAVSTRGKLLAKDTEEMDEQERKEYQKKVDDANWGLIGVLGSLAGVPIKNIRRDAEGIKNLFRTVSRGRNGQRTTYSSLVDEVLSEVQYSLPGGGTGKTSQEKLYGAIMAGDAAYAARLKDRYKSDSSYNTAVRKALRENDPRIRQAAQQRSSGQLSQYRNTMKAILAEKRFSQDDVVAAVNAEINAMSREETASGSAAKAKSLYTADDFRTALTQSGNAMAREIREEILRIQEVNGKTREEAEKSFASSARDTVKEGFLDGSLTGAKAEKALTEYGGRTAQQAKADVEYWAFKRDYPDIYADDSWFDKYYEAVEGSGLDIGTFMDYKNQVTDITGEGKKKRRMAVIHALPITDEQKDALYFAEGWTESRLYEAPWH